MSERRSIDEWLRRAYDGAEGCPPPEAYLAEELGALDAAARARLESHAESCVACAAERDLARAFDGTGPKTAGDRRAVERIVRRLERRPAHRRSGGGLRDLPSWASIARAPALRLAAAAALVIGVGLAIRHAATPPPLTGGPGAGVTRSSSLELLEPLGEIAALPDELSWTGVEGASAYAVTVRGVDDSELWRAQTAATAVAVDATLAAELRPAVWYGWSVEALAPDGRRIAWSPDARFRIRPEPE